jgi:hypothetical protein
MKKKSGMRAGSPLAKSVTAPVFGSTRQMLPVSGAVTNNAPPGPTVLPWSSSRPVTSKVAVGSPGGSFAAATVLLPRMRTILKARTITSLFQFMRFLLSNIRISTGTGFGTLAFAHSF